MNKKIILFFLINCIYSSFIHAQSKHSVSLTLGGAVPVGDFGLKEYNNQNSGYANVGLNMNLNYGFQINKYVSAMALLGAMTNSIDDSKLFIDVNLSSGNQFKSFNVHSIYKLSLLIGPMGTISINKKLRLNPYFLVGVSEVNKPDALYVYTNNDMGFNESKWSTCLSYQTGIGVDYELSKKLFLVAKIDYNYSKVEFKDVKSFKNGNYSFSFNTIQKVITINPTIGLGYKF